ncbi:MAG: BMP family ABC transporter substrate-binding protein [Lachnospiraceae bacterium]|nr:BMP family ABC transporter substrate-binding protein [Lachnospiraceae bacterium]
MAAGDYAKAFKAGARDYKNRIARGEYPYLPVLEEIVSHVDIEGQVPLGLVEIPIKSIVGTYSSGRTTAFASNFMPILESDSEFAMKWSQLYDDILAEGLRDPIKAYEFNNKFYVMEGNKRVSVSKYTDAVSIEGNVTRMVPRKSDDPEVKIYYEFMDFYELTGINYLYMSREGNFRKLLELTYGGDKEWDVEQKQDFRAFFSYFEKEYNLKAAGKLNITPGDAVIVYLGVYGFKEALEKTEADLRKELSRLWPEFESYAAGEELKLVLNPTPESRKVALSKLLPGNSVMKIAFIHDRSAQDSSWTYSHELGRQYVRDVFGDRIVTSCVERVDGDDADDVFEAACEAGNKLIFATSPKLAQAAIKAAVNHPEVTILNCSMNLSHKTIRSYYLRMYEAKFVIGAIAGAMHAGGNIGYLSDYPIHGTTAEINAFAMGVQMTNPGAKVFLEWSMIKDHDFIETFKANNVKLVSGRDLNAKMSLGREFGLYMIDEDGQKNINLAMPVRHWGKLYEEIIRSVMRGGYKNDENVFQEQALNYFWGMSSGAIDVIYSRNLPAGQIRLLRTLRNGVKNMDINPMTGPIYSQDGMIRCEDGETLRPEDAVSIDWLCDNIEGYIPDISQLKEEAVDLVKIQGIKSGVE